MSTAPLAQALPIERIFFPSDFSAESEVAFAHALRIAIDTGAMLDLLHVESGAVKIDFSDFPSVRETLARWGLLPSPDVERGAVAKVGLRACKVEISGSDPVATLLARLEADPADLIVLASHRRSGIERWLHAEVGRRLSRLARLPTLFVPHGSRGFVSLETGAVTLGRILVPVDASPAAQPAIDAAAALARRLGAKAVSFSLLHVGGKAPQVAHHPAPGWTWHDVIRAGDVVEELTEAAAGADLMVVATHGREGFLDALRGSTTERLVASAPCPILAIPAAA